MDHYVKLHAVAVPSYIKDTADFINKINEAENIAEETFLVTLNVKSLYTNIPNHEGIDDAGEVLNSVPKNLIATKVVIKFLFLILKLNNFIFNGIHYLQNLGCAVGTICTPNHVNIFMGKFERNYMYPGLQTFSGFYCQFIDDIIRLHHKIKFKQPIIKFDFKYSKSSIELLDTLIYKNKVKNKLLTTIYRKPIDRGNFLDPISARPKSLIKIVD